jgi:hypothetical protein
VKEKQEFERLEMKIEDLCEMFKVNTHITYFFLLVGPSTRTANEIVSEIFILIG